MKVATTARMVFCVVTAPSLAYPDAVAATGGLRVASANDSFRASFGSAAGATFGGEVRYDLGRRLFATVGAGTFTKSGERVFVADSAGEVFKLGHPLKVRVIPVQATLGYRLRERRRFGKSFAPYFGLGVDITSYWEDSRVGGVSERESLTRGGGHGLVGVEVGRSALRFGIEAQYSFVPGAIGASGVSKVYGESDIGGLSVVGKIIFTSSGR